MSSRKRKELSSLTQTQAQTQAQALAQTQAIQKTQSDQYSKKKSKSKSNTFSFTQEEEENDVLWLDSSEILATSSSSDPEVNVSTHTFSGSAKSILTSISSSPTPGKDKRRKAKDKSIEKSASKSDAVLGLMNSLLESINIDTVTSSDPELMEGIKEQSSIKIPVESKSSTANKSIDDFTEEDFAMLERTAHVRFGPTTVLAPSSSSKSGTQNSQRSSTGFSGSSSSSGSQARPPLRVVDQNAWKGSQPANAPPSALKSAIATSTLPQNRSTSTSSTMQSAGAVSNSRSRASTTPNKVYSQSNQMSQKATQSMSQVAKSQTVPPTTKHVIPAVAAAKSIPMSQTLPPNVKSTSVSSSTKTTAPTPVTAVIEVLSADELAMWDQLEMQATKAIAHATIVPATTTIISTTTTTPKYSAPLNSVLSDARAPILCYKYSVLAVEHHIQGKDRMQRLYCCDLVSSSTRSSSLTIEPPNPTGIVDLWDDWKESALAVGDEILIISLSAADVRAATKYVAGLAPVNVPSANFVDFSDSLPTPPFINNPSGLRRHRIDRDQGLLVTRPRVLISPTRVAEACSCARRCVVSERVRSVFSSSSAAGVLGNLKHDFIEAVLAIFLEGIIPGDNASKPKRALPVTPEDPLIKDMIKKCIRRNLIDLYSVGASDSGAELELKHAFVSTMKWTRETLSKGYASQVEGSRLNYRLTSVVEAEETVWSPFLGLKGKLDIIARGTLALSSSVSASGQNATGSPCLIPVELKTGKWKAAQSINHRAQVILYLLTILLRERGSFVSGASGAGSDIINMTHDKLPQSDELASMEGLLLYLGSLEAARVDVISPAWDEIKGLVLSRNNLAQYLGAIKPAANIKLMQLPPMHSDQRECTYCFQAAECMTYKAIQDDGPTPPGVQTDLFDFSLRHISPLYLSYIRHWESMLALEEEEIDRDSSFWLRDVVDTEGKSSMQRLVLVSAHPTAVNKDKKNNESKSLFTVVLEDRVGRLLDQCRSNISVGDRVTISIEKEGKPRLSLPSSSQNDGTRKGLYTQTTVSGGDVEDLYGGSTQCYSTDAKLNFASDHGNHVFYACEPRVALGIVTQVDENRVTVETTDSVKRLVQMSARGATCRLDISNVAVAVASMRAVLLSLFVDTHDPKAFQEWCKSRIGPAISASASACRLEKLKQHIVDLSSPSFRPEEALGDGILMFAPPNISRDSFNRSLMMLQFYSTDINAARKHFQEQVYVTGISVGPHSRLPNLQSNQYIPAEEFLPGFRICINERGDIHLPDGLVVYPGCNPEDLFREYQRCNTGQQLAIRRVLCSEDYSLLHGYPGTGKSNVIALLVRCLVARGARVMVSAYTHSAVDNILKKLQASALIPGTVLRIGAEESVQASLQPYVLQSEALTSLQELGSLVQHTRVVVCTSLAAFRAPLVRAFDFDYCIIDEAGQMLEPVAIGALMMSRQFVLVGDPCQLPPLVVSAQARTLGMDVSLFDRLAKAHPQAISSLTSQYRMNEDILHLCNSLFYKNAMICGSPQVAISRLQLPDPLKVPTPLLGPTGRSSTKPQLVNWVFECINPRRSVLFLDTDSLTMTTSGITAKSAPKSVSIEEAEIVRILVRSFEACGVDVCNAIGVVTPFRAQIKAINTALNSNKSSGSAVLPLSTPAQICEVSTVDRYQGRDKEIVLFSTATCTATSEENSTRQVGEILTDWRRLNVAISRARTKLIILGSLSTLKASQVPALMDLTTLLAQRNSILSLRPDALQQFKHM